MTTRVRDVVRTLAERVLRSHGQANATEVQQLARAVLMLTGTGR